MRTVYSSRSFPLLHRLFPDDSRVFSDNAYRLLRQDLFQRFGPLAGQIPTEPGMVKMPLPSSRNLNGMCFCAISLWLTDSNPITVSTAPLNQADPSQVTSPTLPKGDSNFNVSKSSRSIRSTHSRASSVTTAVTSLFRRAPSVSSHVHHPSTTSGGGAGSIVSGRTSGVFEKNVAPPRTLVHKASFGSFGSGAGSGSVMFDGRSISSRRTGRSTAAPGSGFVHDPLSSVGAGLSRSTTRSTRGPPSSYHRRHAHGGVGGHGSDEDGAGRIVPDDWTAAEIRAEIVNIEEEMHRVGDMFRGLEVSRLVKAGVAGPGRTMEGEDERTWTVVQGGGSRYYANSGAPMVRADGAGAAGGGAVKRRSGVFGSKLGRKGSLNFLRRPPPPLPPLPTLIPVTPTTPTAHSSRPHPPLPPLPSSHSAYATSSSASSSRAFAPRHVPTLMSLPPTTPLTTTSHPSSLTVSPAHAHTHAHTHAQAYPVAPNLMSMPSRSSPHLPLARWGSQTQIGDAGAGGSVVGRVESDIEEVRRKRVDVEARYEKRLEYLRARLKAAEIHERLLR